MQKNAEQSMLQGGEMLQGTLFPADAVEIV
jgi:hypothetical protein